MIIYSAYVWQNKEIQTFLHLKRLLKSKKKATTTKNKHTLCIDLD